MNAVFEWHSSFLLLQQRVRLVGFLLEALLKWMVILTVLDGLGSSSSKVFLLSPLQSLLTGPSTTILARKYHQIESRSLRLTYCVSAKFLTEPERDEVERRLKADRHSLADEFDLKYVLHALKDWKIYVHMFITIGIYTPLYSISLFLPTIVKNLGYTNNTAQLMTVPPYVVACFFTIGAGYAADKMKQRGIFMLIFEAVAIIGFALLLGSGKPHVQYTGTFFAASGIYPLVPMGVAWNGNNIGGSLKRGVGIAMHVGFGNLGGTISAFIYLTKYAPRFKPGHSALIGTVSMSFVLTLFMTIWLRGENKRRDESAKSLNLTPEDWTESQKEEEREKGDYAKFFRYTV